MRQAAEKAGVVVEDKSSTKRGAADVFQRLEQAAYITRTWGDCYGYLMVATGRASPGFSKRWSGCVSSSPSRPNGAIG